MMLVFVFVFVFFLNIELNVAWTRPKCKLMPNSELLSVYNRATSDPFRSVSLSSTLKNWRTLLRQSVELAIITYFHTSCSSSCCFYVTHLYFYVCIQNAYAHFFYGRPKPKCVSGMSRMEKSVHLHDAGRKREKKIRRWGNNYFIKDVFPVRQYGQVVYFLDETVT